jgi:16S rRNA (adenine1518-N6/adenine1519-N6)-dimethyltransferase
MTFPRTSAALRDVLERHGIRPRKGRGQNFLTDPQAVDAIVRDAEVVAADRVVEVGTGPGLLTHALCETGAEVISFDVDPVLQSLARSLRPWPERVRFETMDVLEDKHHLAPAFAEAFGERPAAPGRLKLISNLPYSAATPILLGVLSLAAPPDTITVMVQEEVGEKMLADAGGRAYGVPSVAVGLKATGRILRRFGPQVFWPRPRVRSVLLALTPVTPAPLAPAEHAPFGAFVTALFTRRRKVLPTALRAALPALSAESARAGVEAQGLDPRVRVEALEPAALLDLWRALRPEP